MVRTTATNGFQALELKGALLPASLLEEVGGTLQWLAAQRIALLWRRSPHRVTPAPTSATLFRQRQPPMRPRRPSTNPPTPPPA
jgi:hypothetical protein